MAADMDKVAHVAIDLAKAGAWPQLFKFLDEDKCEGDGSTVLANARPAPRKYGLLHQAAWHGQLSACKILVEKYAVDPTSLSEDGKTASEIAADGGFGDVAQTLRGYEESLSGTLVSMSVLLPSGSTLLEKTQLPPSAKVGELLKLAAGALSSRLLEDSELKGNVSALCSADGRVLEPAHSLLVAGLADGSCLTAVITDDAQSLLIIETHFHSLIMKMNGCPEDPSVLTAKGFCFPSLEAHVESYGTSSEYYAVPGMYGGFNTVVIKEESGWRLTCDSWCRVCEGSEQTHEITVTGVKKIGREE